MKKSEQARIERMLLLGCVACAAIGVVNHHMIECHHILDGGRRMGHRFTIPLCKGHHQGNFTVVQNMRLLPEERASIAGGRKLFNQMFGTERKLLEKTDFLLGLDTPSPKTKIVTRRAA
jgi:hypothetical protein